MTETVKECDNDVDLNCIDKKRAKFFQDLIVKWYDLRGRKDLPWRNTKDPWRVLIAGILLRKTTAKQVLNIYNDFILKYPTASHIVEVDEKNIRKEIITLGMENIKAGQLKTASLKIIEDYNNQIPVEYNQLKSLKGVGDYIASEIQLIAYDIPKPLLDRNMIRIISRVFSVTSKNKRPHTDKELWRFASLLVPLDIDQAKCFNFGILDLGDLICTARNPKCVQCPILSICDYGNDKALQPLSQNSHFK